MKRRACWASSLLVLGALVFAGYVPAQSGGSGKITVLNPAIAGKMAKCGGCIHRFPTLVLGSLPCRAPPPPAILSAFSPAEALNQGLFRGYMVVASLGTVFAAVHPLIGKRAAIKVLKPELSRNRDAVERFALEARAVNQIGHPNIVDIFAFGVLNDGRSYYVMDLLAGESLRTRLDRDGQLGDGRHGQHLCASRSCEVRQRRACSRHNAECRLEMTGDRARGDARST